MVIEKKNPLKQGLKLPSSAPLVCNVLIEKKNPLKQGLKLDDLYAVYYAGIHIEKKNPLKQGLKQRVWPSIYLYGED